MQLPIGSQQKVVRDQMVHPVENQLTVLPHELGHLLPLGEHGPDDELAEGVLEPVALQPTIATAAIADAAEAIAAAIVAAAAAIVVFIGSRTVVPSPRRQRQGRQLQRERTQSQFLNCVTT